MDKKLSELAAASAIDAADVSVLVHNNTDYQYTFTTLLTFLGNNLQLGAGISFGTTLPQNTAGKNGDVFVNTAAGSFAQKINGVWSVVYTLPMAGSQADGTVLYGLGVPANSTGNNNDTYINTGTGIFYKRTAGAWNPVFTMLNGPAGAKGDKGNKGDTGASGRTLLSGTANPSNIADGANGDYYINTSTYTLFGPKTAGVWGSGVNLVGPDGAKGDTGNAGPAGAAGAAGPGVAAGGTTGQVLKKLAGDNFATGWANEQDISGKADIIDVDAADAVLQDMIDALTASAVMITGDQEIAGDKTFNGTVTVGGFETHGAVNIRSGGSLSLSGNGNIDGLLSTNDLSVANVPKFGNTTSGAVGIDFQSGYDGDASAPIYDWHLRVIQSGDGSCFGLNYQGNYALKADTDGILYDGIGNRYLTTADTIGGGDGDGYALPALTAGSVLFSNGSDIAEDNSNLFWDNTNKRLGLGTDSPNTGLDTRGYGSFSDGTYGLQIGPYSESGHQYGAIYRYGETPGTDNYVLISKPSTTYLNSGTYTALSVQDNGVLYAAIDRIYLEVPINLTGYTVATLPAGTQGDTAFVTDALSPAYLTPVIGGGSTVTRVFYDGAAWVA